MGLPAQNLERIALLPQKRPVDKSEGAVALGKSQESGGGHDPRSKRPHDADLSDRPLKRPTPNAIHASWEAAKLRREKEASLMFVPAAGKKTVFRDDIVLQAPVLQPQLAPKAEPPSKPPEKSSMCEKEHPSWAAKQAQKDKASGGFQGKKTVFG